MSKTSAEKTTNVCMETVARELCVGCGVCAGICPKGNLTISWDDYGQYRPKDEGKCASVCRLCLSVCPFADHSENEDTLGTEIFSNNSGINHVPEAGFYLSAGVGFANNEYRARGSSGGLASWFMANLIEQGIVDRVVSVAPNPDPEKLFRFRVFDNPEEVRAASKSCYYPVELSEVIRTMLAEEARYAVIGLPCFVKGLRLAMKKNRVLRERIHLIAGLTCGQLKSRAYAEYCCRYLGVNPSSVTGISFREKYPDLPASRYGIRVTDSENQSAVCEADMSIFCSNEFRLRSCNACDDIFAELADITFMDAWLPQYQAEPSGTSLVLTRSQKAEALLDTGRETGELNLEPISIQDVIASQMGVVDRKRERLQYSLWLAQKSGNAPKKRITPKRPKPGLSLELIAQEKLRTASQTAMLKQRVAGKDGLDIYLAGVRHARNRIQILRRLYGATRLPLRILRRIFR